MSPIAGAAVLTADGPHPGDVGRVGGPTSFWLVSPLASWPSSAWPASRWWPSTRPPASGPHHFRVGYRSHRLESRRSFGRVAL
jgi:hypothetical protein